MNKEIYKEAMNEIKPEEELKKNTLMKIKAKNRIKKSYAFASIAVMFVVAISIWIPINNTNNNVSTKPITVIEDNSGLPRIDSFNNLYNMINESYQRNTRDEISISQSINTEESLEVSEKNVNEYSDYSKTNIQVEGVDEADIVKTDGHYIYYIGTNKVVIVDIKDSAKMKIVSEINFDENQININELYISGDKLVVIGGNNANYKTEVISTTDIFYNTSSFTVANIYNISNKSAPKLEREIKIEGYYISSRMIEDNIYIISSKNINSYIFNNTNIEQLNENDFKPKYLDTNMSNEIKHIDYKDISYFPESDEINYLIIASFNINNKEAVNIETYLGAGTTVYSTMTNLYIARTKYEYKDVKYYGYYNNYDLNTYIYKFKLNNTNIIYENTGYVPGKILNQFSMDENDGYFRIATTDSDNWSNETNSNNLYILNEKLEVVGKLENLAKGERIYSVRFIENRAYMVTFKETDPLFVIDLSDPINPSVLGELKIPGYSKYLHPYDKNHIIGFGEDTETTNHGAIRTTGMKMALFDITDPNKPKELYMTKIGDRGTYSEILYNHKSLLFSKEKDMLAFPIYITEKEGNNYTNLTFQGAIIYQIDLENGFLLKGKVSNMEIEEGYNNYEYTKSIERIIYINDKLFTLSRDVIKAISMNTLEELGRLEISDI